MAALQQNEAIEILSGLLLAIGQNESANYSDCTQSMRDTTDLVKSATVFIAMYVVPLVSVLGLVSNALVCVVVYHRGTAIQDKGRTMYSAIAVADSMQILVNSMGQVFFLYGLNMRQDVRGNETMCRFLAFLSTLTIGLSNNYAATFATERCLSVYWQARDGVGGSHTRLLNVVAVVTGLQLLEAIAFGLSFDLGMDWHNSQSYCIMGKSYIAQVMQLISRLCTIYVPCALLLASDVALLVFLLRRRQRRQAGSTCCWSNCSGKRRGPERNRMDAIVSNTKACVLMSSLRCTFLLGSIVNALKYQSLLSLNGEMFDHCAADLLLAFTVLLFSASVLVLASNFYVLLWRVRSFSQGFRALWQRTSPRLALTQTRRDTEPELRGSVWMLKPLQRSDIFVPKLVS